MDGNTLPAGACLEVVTNILLVPKFVVLKTHELPRGALDRGRVEFTLDAINGNMHELIAQRVLEELGKIASANYANAFYRLKHRVTPFHNHAYLVDYEIAARACRLTQESLAEYGSRIETHHMLFR